jgi:VanZ family protein
LLAEWAQRYLPGRTPEITDPVLMLAGWVLVVLVGQSEEARSEN